MKSLQQPFTDLMFAVAFLQMTNQALNIGDADQA
jgi:hypothetical protein